MEKLRILDAGCGTGLCAPFLKKYASWHGLEGVDLSSGMLAEAARKKLYARLYCQELCAFLSGHKKRYDLIAAADVLTYFGDLDSVFAGFAFALKKTGGSSLPLRRTSMMIRIGICICPGALRIVFPICKTRSENTASTSKSQN